MSDRRIKNAIIFKDTVQMYQTNEILKAAVENSIKNQKLIFADEVMEYGMPCDRAGKVEVSGKRTLEASERYAKQGKRVCVLNFASATNPGGGVIHGASAQEEAICRCSTLYPCLNIKTLWEIFYTPHRELDDPLYNDDCIFTPAVKVFKSDNSSPELLPEKEWWDVDVITCAAPNLRSIPSNMMNPDAGSKQADITYDGLKVLFRTRIRRIFEIAIVNNAEVLILGAFGCGAFCNPPRLVAEVFAEMTEEYRSCFEKIEYAVYHTEWESANFAAFQETMKRFF